MKRLYKSFLGSYLAISFLLFLGLSFAFYTANEREARNRLEEILVQLETRYDMEQTVFKEKMRILEKDYLNRAEVIAYFVSTDEKFRTVENLRMFRDMMKIQKINFIDANGVITLSGNLAAVGLDLHNQPDSEELLNLAVRGKRGDVLVSLGQKDEEGNRIRDYVAVHLNGPEFAAVEITFYSSEIDTAIAESSLSYVIKNFLTEYDITVAAVNPEGFLLGRSLNNEQRTEIEGVYSREDLMKFLAGAKDGEVVKINGRPSYILSRELDGNTICGYYDRSNVLHNYLINLGVMTLVLALSGAAIIMLLHHFFQKYLVKDFEQMQEDIKIFMTGDAEHQIRPVTNEELDDLNHAIRMMTDGYRNKSERMNKILGGVNSNVAAFECLEYTNYVFVSDNMKKVLGISEQQVRVIQSSIHNFESFMSVLEGLKDGNGMVPYNGRWLQISSYRLDKEYFGMVVDKTVEYKEKLETNQELEQIRRMAQMDGLTRLYGRSGFEQNLLALLENQNVTEGTMLLFDLDNFKRINDSLGHPEGDRALRKMAKCLKREFRKSDIVGRLGGDEFVVFMPDVPARDQLEEKLKEILDSAHDALSDYKEYAVSVSIGIAFYGGLLRDYKALYEGADTALYIAKETGKNGYYINDDSIRCMEKNCKNCRKNCPRKRILGLE